MADNTDAMHLATELTIAWLSNPSTRASAEDVPSFLSRMHTALAELGTPAPSISEEPAAAEHTPALSPRKSLSSRDHIISMIDGKPYRTLRRHLTSNGLTPEQYRERYKLKADYPMVAESYSESRRAMAEKIGLGRKPGQKVSQPAPDAAPEPTAAPIKRGRKPKAPE
jgi:predicted transcriptional regulator